MADYVICASCGALMRGNRDRCLRCDEPLVAASPAPEIPPRDRALVIRTLASLVLVILFAVVWQARTPPPDPDARPATRVSRKTSAPSGPPAARPSVAPVTPATAIESNRLGAAAYSSGNFETARAHLEEALRKDPRNVDVLNNLGLLLAREKRTDEAIELFTKAATAAPDRWASHFNLAHAFGEQAKWDAAIGEYRIAARLFPDDYAVEYNLGMALHKKGDEDAAVVQLQKAIALAPGEPTFHLSLGLSLEKLGRTADARDEFRRYLEMRPDAPDAQQVKAHLDALAGAPPTAPKPPVS